MGCCASALHSGSYVTREGTGCGPVPSDSLDAPPQPGQVKSEAGREPSDVREECKPDVARVGPEKPPPDSRPPEPIPGRTSHEPGTPVDQDVAKRPGDGAPDAPPRSALTKKPSKLESAKEDVLGVFESMKKNVGAAKEAFFERPGKTDQPKPASPKSTEPKTPDVPEVKKAEDEKGKSESFLQKLRFGKSEEHKSKEKSSPEAVSSLAETEKQPTGTHVPQFRQNVSALAETPGLLREKAQGALDAGKTNVELMSKQAHDATVSLKQTSQDVFDAGRVEAESLKQKSQHVLDVGKAQADALKQTSQEAVEAGKVQAESLKQKPQEVVDATKAQVESLKQTTEQSLESIKQQVLDAGQAQAESLKHKSVEAFDAGKAQADFLKQKSCDVIEAGKAKAEGVKQASQEAVDFGKNTLGSLHQKSLEAAEATKEKTEDLKQRSQDTIETGKSKAASVLQQVQTSVVTAADQLKMKSQEALEVGKQQAQMVDHKSREVVVTGKTNVEDLKHSAQEAVQAAKSKALETADSAKEKAHETTDAAKAKAEDMKLKAQDALYTEKSKAEQAIQDAVDAGKTKAGFFTDKSAETLDASNVKVGAFIQELTPTVLAATDGAKQASQEAVDIGKSDVAFLQQKSVDAASVLREMSKDAAATTGKTADSLTDKAKETYDIGKQKVDTFLQQVKPAVVGASDTVKQRSQDGFDAGKSMADSYAQQIKAFMFDESDAANKSPPDVSADEKSALALGAEEEPARTLLDQVKFAALSSQAALELAYRDPLGLENKDEATKGASRTEVLGSPETAAFQGGKEKSFDGFGKQASECLQTDSQEMFDSAKSKAELLVEHVISSVVGASESLKHASEDAFGSDKEKIEFLKERAQQEFESGKSKTNSEHANQQVSSGTRLEFEGTGGEQPKPSELVLLHVEQGDRRSLSPKLDDIETAVVKIQAGVRGYLTRKNLHERSPQPQHDDSEYQTADADHGEASGESDPSSTAAAATKIQAAFRGYRVRKELKPDNGPSGLHKEERELVESR